MRFAEPATFDHPITTSNMSYQPSQSGQRSRRGGSRNRGEGRSGRPNSERRGGNGTKPPAPASLWQKITAFFTGSKSAPVAKKSTFAESSSRPAASADRGDTRPKSDSETPRVSRKPEAVEVTTPRLYVGNLSFDATEGDLTELFNGVGQVVAVEVVSHRQTQRSKGFAFVQMQTVDEAKRAVLELHDKEFMARKLVVSGAKNIDEHDGRSEPRFAA